MKKRLLCLVIALVLAVTCFGCAKATTTASNVDTSTTEPTEENLPTSDENTTTEEVTEPSKPKYTVANGCTYYDASTGVTLKAGEVISNVVEVDDVYTTSDYIYTYATYKKGWIVKVIDTTKTNYEEILSSIAGVSVTSLVGTFRGCTNLTTAPEIPSSVIDMEGTFIRCTSLTTAPVIPFGVKNISEAFWNCTSLTNVSEIPSSVGSMDYTFSGCTSLTTAPEIPSSVKFMNDTFEGCTSLTGTITINANPAFYNSCFHKVDFETQNITLTGSSTMLEELRATGK